jgi:high affinity Mn2+ porin
MTKDLTFFMARATSKTTLDAAWGVGVYGNVYFVNHALSRQAKNHPIVTMLALVAVILPAVAEDATNSPAENQQNWNFHVQNTDIVQGYPGFSSQYSGPNSLPSGGETRESVSLDLMAGVRLWPGAEAHVDGMMWQGFGFHNTLGVEGFPNGEAFRLGTGDPNGAITRLFIRQTIGLGGRQEDVPDDELTLAGKQDTSRITITIGRFSAKDIFDNNAYANDPRTQFMNCVRGSFA